MKNYVLLFAVILLLSCNPREEKESCDVVDLTPFQNEEVSDDIVQYVEDVQLIALETSDSCLMMGYPQNIIIDDDRIIIVEHQLSRQPVKIFDRKGQFIASVKTGQGPGEVSMANTAAVDKKLKQILVYHEDGIMHYDYDGKYIKDDRIDFNFYQFEVYRDELVFIMCGHQTNEMLGEKGGYKVYVMDREYNVKSFNHPIEVDLSFEKLRTIFQVEDKVVYIKDLDDTGYYYRDGEYGKLFTLRYDNLFADGYPKSEEEIERLLETMKKKDGYWIELYGENETHQFFRIRNDYGRKMVSAYRDKRSGHVKGSLITFDERVHNPNFKTRSPYNSYKDYFCTIIDPEVAETYLKELSSLLSDEEKKMLENISEESNPLLLMYKLKEF